MHHFMDSLSQILRDRGFREPVINQQLRHVVQTRRMSNSPEDTTSGAQLALLLPRRERGHL
jgi:hypothetical protein